MDEMILLVSDEIYPLSLSADNAAGGANKDTAFLRRHISQISAFSLFRTETQGPAARPPRLAAPIPAAMQGFTPFAAKSPVLRLHCEGASFPAPAVGGIVCVPQGRASLRAAAGMEQCLGLLCSRAKRHEPHTCRKWKLLWLCPIFKGELSPSSQGSGLSGAAKSLCAQRLQ